MKKITKIILATFVALFITVSSLAYFKADLNPIHTYEPIYQASIQYFIVNSMTCIRVVYYKDGKLMAEDGISCNWADFEGI